MEACSILKIPTFATEQYPKGLGSTVAEIKLKVNLVLLLNADKNTFQ